MTIGLCTIFLGIAIFIFYFCLPERFPEFYKKPLVWTFLLYFLVPAFWLSLLTDLYLAKWIHDILLKTEINYRLSNNVFWVWENLPASQHHWLPFFDKNDLTTSYSSGGMVFYLFLYMIAKIPAVIFNISLVKTQFALAYFYSFLQVWVIVYSIQKLTGIYAPDKRQRFAFFYLASFFVLLPGTWVEIICANQDHIMPLIGSYTFLWAVSLYKKEYLDKVHFIGLLLLGIITPICGVLFSFLTIAYIYFADTIPVDVKKKIYLRNAIAIGLFMVFYIIIKFLMKYYGVNEMGSSFWFRSGLDGDTAYFSNLIDSFIYPLVHAAKFRLYSEFLPTIVFGMIACIWGLMLRNEPWHRLFLLAASFYLIQLVLFPQAVKIHPYLYDASLTIPVLGASFYVLLRPAFLKSLSPSGMLYYNLLMTAFILSNMIILARAARGVTLF